MGACGNKGEAQQPETAKSAVQQQQRPEAAEAKACNLLEAEAGALAEKLPTAVVQEDPVAAQGATAPVDSGATPEAAETPQHTPAAPLAQSPKAPETPHSAQTPATATTPKASEITSGACASPTPQAQAQEGCHEGGATATGSPGGGASPVAADAGAGAGEELVATPESPQNGGGAGATAAPASTPVVRKQKEGGCC